LHERVRTARVLTLAAAMLLVAAAVFLLYRTFLGGYLWDDDFGLIAAGRTFDSSWTLSFANRNHFYRPLIEFYFDLAYALVGYSPRALHAANIGLHVINAWLVLAIALRVLRTSGGACAAALFFAVLPGILDTIAWVSAVTALLMTCCYLAALVAHFKWLETRLFAWRIASFAGFVAALLSHEGAVTLLPMLIGVEWLVSGRMPAGRGLARRYGIFMITLCGYLAIAVVVNRQNYVVTEGHYRIGLHAVGNIVDYIVTLGVGRRGLAGWVTVGVALLGVAWAGSPAMRFAAAWMIIALVPYSFFTWTGSARYAYLAAVGFSLLLAAVTESVATALGSRLGRTLANAVTAVLVVVIAGRFAVFAGRGAPHAVAPGEVYRAWLASFRRTHPTLPPGEVLNIDASGAEGINALALMPMLQLEYDDRELRVEMTNR
jgi:uncharacterized membrane protein SirB2